MFALSIKYVKYQDETLLLKYELFHQLHEEKVKLEKLLRHFNLGSLDFLLYDEEIVKSFVEEHGTNDIINELIKINPNFIIDNSIIEENITETEHFNFSKALINTTENLTIKAVKPYENDLYGYNNKTKKLYKIAFYDFQRRCYILHRNFIKCNIETNYGKIYKSKREFDEEKENRGWQNRKLYVLYFNDENYYSMILHDVPNNKKINDLLKDLVISFNNVNIGNVEKIRIEVYVKICKKTLKSKNLIDIYKTYNNKKYIKKKEYIFHRDDIISVLSV
jgi:hypothetical protein